MKTNVNKNLRAHEGSSKLLKECLQLSEGDFLGIFYDETTLELVDVIVCEAKKLGLKPNLRYVPISEQTKFSKIQNKELCEKDEDIISCSRAILTCLSSDIKGTSYRTAIVRAKKIRDS